MAQRREVATRTAAIDVGTIAIDGIDLSLLREQRAALEALICEEPDEHILWGIIHFLETIEYELEKSGG
ncbi:MAG: hypothetical protein ACE5JM_17530 [Armatimonadota bacterium]